MVYGRSSTKAAGVLASVPSPSYLMSWNSSSSSVLATPPSSSSSAACSWPNATAAAASVSAASEQLSGGEVAALALALALLWLVSLLGNALVCLVVHRSRRAQSTTNYFVVAMAAGDLLLSLGVAPLALLQVAAGGGWPLGAAACKLARFLQHLCPGAQLYVLLSIAVDRFYTIVHPLSFKVSRETAKRMIAASWLLAAALVSPCLLFYGGGAGGAGAGVSEGERCDFFLPDSWAGAAYAASHLLLGLLAPAALIAAFYQRVVRYIWRLGADGRTLRRTANTVPRTKVKTIKMFLVLNWLFLLTWTPFYAAQLWHPGEPSPPSAPSSGRRRRLLLFAAVAWLSVGSAASKPTLYSVYNANFRRGMRETFCASSMKCYRSNAYTITASSRLAKKNYVGVADASVHAKTVAKDAGAGGGDAFERDAKETKVAWPTAAAANPPNTFV